MPTVPVKGQLKKKHFSGQKSMLKAGKLNLEFTLRGLKSFFLCMSMSYWETKQY